MQRDAQVVFDPLLAGPSAHGGPLLLQTWARDEQGRFVQPRCVLVVAPSR